jgi:hypothetical protein
MEKYMKKYIIIIFIIFVIIIIPIISYFTIPKKITYYKCSERPNNPLLSNVLKSHKINLQKEGFDFYMPCGYNNIENEMSDNIFYGKYIFGLRGCDKIVSKNSIWSILEMTFGRSFASKIMPETFVLSDEEQIDMAFDEIKNKKTLICKKNVQRKMGLKFASTKKELLECISDDFKIAQNFMKNTLTIKGRKMNIRIYFLIKKQGNKITFYLYNNGKILYTNKKTGGKVSFDTHITSYQMDSNIYKNENLPHSINDLINFLGKDIGYKIWKNIEKKMSLLSRAISNVFYDEMHYNKICFQLFGVDVIVDENGDPFILEINKGPDMIPKCEQDEKLKKIVYEDTMRIGGVIGWKFRKNGFNVIHQHYF